MAEEYRMYYQHIDGWKKKYGNGTKDELLKHIFLEGFGAGKKVGFDAGYTKAISDEESFNFDESQDDYSFDDEMDNATYEKFDDSEEVLNF